MTTPTFRERSAARGLTAIYKRYGTPSALTLDGHAALPSVLPILEVRDAEEGLEGQKIEAVIAGYTARFRTSDIPAAMRADLLAWRGGVIDLNDGRTFGEFARFRIDEDPRKFGRDGQQLIVKITGVALSAAESWD